MLMACIYLSKRSGMRFSQVFNILMEQYGYKGRVLIDASDHDYIYVYDLNTSRKSKRSHLG